MIPVSVLTGFLGSGKTTILAHLLRDPALGDTAVIINEFGDIGLDHDLIETSDETLVTLTTGCLCCKMQGDLVATLQDLLTRSDAGEIEPFARVVIETSGLADPAPILQGLMVDEVAANNFSLARVLTVVDAVNGEATLARQSEARKQVAVADRLVLSKTDLLSETDLADGDLASIKDAVRSFNTSVPLQTVRHGKLDPAELFPASGASIDAEAILESASVADQSHGDQNAHAHPHDTISTFAIVRDQPVSAVALSLFLEALADHCGSDLLRLKGLVRIAEHDAQPAVIHGVQHVFHPPVWLDVWPSDDRRTRIVFIASGIDQAWVEALFDAIALEVQELATDPNPA